MPLTTKLYREVEGLKEQIIDKGTAMMVSANQIFLVGYRAADEIIFDMLQSAGKDLKPGGVFSEGFARFVETYPKLA